MLEVLYLSGELHTRFKLSYHKIMLQSFCRSEVVYVQFNSLMCVCGCLQILVGKDSILCHHLPSIMLANQVINAHGNSRILNTTLDLLLRNM